MVNTSRTNLRSRPLDHGDPRTPMAWQHRNMNYQQNQGLQYQSYHMKIGRKLATESYSEDTGAARDQHYQQQSNQQIRPTSPSTDSGTSSSTAEPDMDSQMKYNSQYSEHNVQPDIIAGSQPRLGTLRSMQSTLSTWDGEPCPVHHMNAAPVPLLIPTVGSPPHYAMHTLPTPPPPPPPMLLPPMLRPRPLVLPADNPAPPTPLPVRDPRSPASFLNSKNFVQAKSINCCTGNVVLLWIILTIVFLGVLLGVITRLVIA